MTLVSVLAAHTTASKQSWLKKWTLVMIQSVADKKALLGAIKKKSGFCVPYHPALARVAGSLLGGIVLQQCLFLTEHRADAEGWIGQGVKEWTDNLSVGRSAFDHAVKDLATSGIVQKSVAGAGNGNRVVLYLRVDLERLSKTLNGSQKLKTDERRKSTNVENQRSRTLKTCIPIRKVRLKNKNSLKTSPSAREQFRARCQRIASKHPRLVRPDATADEIARAVPRVMKQYGVTEARALDFLERRVSRFAFLTSYWLPEDFKFCVGSVNWFRDGAYGEDEALWQNAARRGGYRPASEITGEHGDENIVPIPPGSVGQLNAPAVNGGAA